MKLHLSTTAGMYQITGYGAGHVLVNGVRYEKSLIVMPERIIEDWEVADFEELTAAHFELLGSLKPEVVLLGTGPRLRFPHPALSRCLAEARIGLEVMDTSAACRTYNILMAEGRRVVAALLLPQAPQESGMNPLLQAPG
ncbi:MAG: Mth938-like domain-containing protein [Betaproteobacteria bacterium]|nr:Mth938-like domain-containing protein [Betaproteobacteria bacterium]